MAANDPSDQDGALAGLSGADRARLDYLSAPAGVDLRLDALDGLDAADRADLDELRALLGDETLWAEPPADLEDSVVDLIAAEAGKAGRGSDDASTVIAGPITDPATGSTTASTTASGAAPDFSAPAGPGPDDPDAVEGFAGGPVDLAAARERRVAREQAGFAPSGAGSGRARRRWSRPGILAAAAAVVAAVALSGVLIIRAVTPSPEFSADLTGTDLAPGASGTVTMLRTESGWDIRLNATGLPRLDGGDFYQAWLRNDEGVLVPIGSFNEGTDVILWAGVTPQLFSTFTVTRETADGVQDSSGERVLVGTATPTG